MESPRNEILVTKMKSTLKTLLFVLGALLLCAEGRAQNFVTNKIQALSLVHDLKFQQGDVNLRNGLAKLNVPAEFKFLNHEDAEKVLVQLWNNPPSTDTLGMLLPADKSPLDKDCWAVTISYTEDGY